MRANGRKITVKISGRASRETFWLHPGPGIHGIDWPGGMLNPGTSLARRRRAMRYVARKINVRGTNRMRMNRAGPNDAVDGFTWVVQLPAW
jgi:hypothetical protein